MDLPKSSYAARGPTLSARSHGGGGGGGGPDDLRRSVDSLNIRALNAAAAAAALPPPRSARVGPTYSSASSGSRSSVSGAVASAGNLRSTVSVVNPAPGERRCFGGRGPAAI